MSTGFRCVGQHRKACRGCGEACGGAGCSPAAHDVPQCSRSPRCSPWRCLWWSRGTWPGGGCGLWRALAFHSYVGPGPELQLMERNFFFFFLECLRNLNRPISNFLALLISLDCSAICGQIHKCVPYPLCRDPGFSSERGVPLIATFLHPPFCPLQIVSLKQLSNNLSISFVKMLDDPSARHQPTWQSYFLAWPTKYSHYTTQVDLFKCQGDFVIFSLAITIDCLS